MSGFSLRKLRRLRRALVRTKHAYYTKLWGMDIDPTVEFSLSARFDRTYPRGVHIGHHTYVALEAVILCHDRTRGLYVDTTIGANCFIGARSLIMPGITIGDGAIVGAGSVVTKDVPPRAAVAGNPAVVIKNDLDTIEYGRLRSADAKTFDLARQGLIR